MIYIINGTDQMRTRAKYNATIDSLLKRKKDATLFKVRSDEFRLGEFEEMIIGRSLFGGSFIIGGDHLSENQEALDYLSEHGREMKESANVFIFLEDDDKLAKSLKKFTEKVETIDTKKVIEDQNYFNIFSISDALLERDSGKMWVAFQKALKSGLSDEDIFFRNIVWIVKSMLAVRLTDDAEAWGVKPGTAQKVKRFAGKYANQEVKELFSSLLDIHNRCRLGYSEFGVEIEKLILRLRG